LYWNTFSKNIYIIIEKIPDSDLLNENDDNNNNNNNNNNSDTNNKNNDNKDEANKNDSNKDDTNKDDSSSASLIIEPFFNYFNLFIISFIMILLNM